MNYYWTFIFYDEEVATNMINPTTVEVKTDTYEHALKMAISLLPDDMVMNKKVKLNRVIVADLHK